MRPVAVYLSRRQRNQLAAEIMSVAEKKIADPAGPAGTTTGPAYGTAEVKKRFNFWTAFGVAVCTSGAVSSASLISVFPRGTMMLMDTSATVGGLDGICRPGPLRRRVGLPPMGLDLRVGRNHLHGLCSGRVCEVSTLLLSLYATTQLW